MAKDPYRPLDFLVLPMAALRTATAGLPPDTLGILLQLLIRCAAELNSGRIDNAAATTSAPRCNVLGIWHWEGETLVIDCYPADYEAKCIAKRLGYSSNARARWEKSRPAPHHAIASESACNGMQKTMDLQPQFMQSHHHACNGMQETMPLHPRAGARVPEHLNFNGGGRYSTPPPPAAAHPSTPPTNNEDFNKWKRTLMDTHPAGRRLKALPWDVLVSAWQCFQCAPDAVEQAPLLEAYMASRVQKDKYGHRFFRSTGLARYFDTLPDHLSHAERWALETGFYKKRKTPAQPTPQPPEDTASAADMKAFLSEISIFKNEHAPQQHDPDHTAPAETSQN